jgi:uncharacterized ubiquitin-like protein YukD
LGKEYIITEKGDLPNILKSYKPINQEEKIIETEETKKISRKQSNRTYILTKNKKKILSSCSYSNYLQSNSKQKINKKYNNNG